MVTKQSRKAGRQEGKFESCVVLDGNQTTMYGLPQFWQFESCVVLDGNQTGP